MGKYQLQIWRAMFNQWIHRNQNHDLEIECVLKALNLASKAVIWTGWLSDLDATCAQYKSILDTPAVISKLPLRVGNLCTLWKCKSILLFGFTSQQKISACNKLWHKLQQQIRLLSGNKTAFTQPSVPFTRYLFANPPPLLSFQTCSEYY